MTAILPARAAFRHGWQHDGIMVDWIDRDLRRRGIRDPRVLDAMARVRREDFVPAALASAAYDDGPLPIGEGQTISQPYIVAYMTQLLDVRPGARVLEIGTGSGYQTAVLMRLGADVFSIEASPRLLAAAGERLVALGLDPAHLRVGDGAAGWPERAPFDRIVLTCAPLSLPPALGEQLAPGGRLVAPLGPAAGEQRLTVVDRDAGGPLRARRDLPVRFVPLVQP